MKFQTTTLGIFLVAVTVSGGFYFFKTEPITNYPSSGTDIIAFGDSLVEGVGAADGNDFVALLSKRVGRPIINLGHSGDTTAAGLVRIDQLDAYKPKVVLLLLGGNDYLRKVPISETRKNLAELIQNIQSRGAVVLLLGVRGGILNDRFDSEFEDLRDTYHTAFVPDVLDGLLGDAGLMSDTVHPNTTGHKVIAEKIYPVLMQVLN